jgi:hypothetical protein
MTTASSCLTFKSGDKALTAYMCELEAFIDRYGVADVLHALEKICDAKAEHIAVNWQDAKSAKQWAKFAHAIEKARYEVAK